MAADTLSSSALPLPARTERPAASPPDVAEVYQQHFKYVWRCLRGLGVRDDAVDDAVQDVFLVVRKKLDQFDGQAQLSTWLYAIALRVARRYRTRATQEARKLVSDEAVNDAGAEPAATNASPSSNDFEHSERLDLARRALEALDDDKREAFVLACVEQRSAPEIAQITGLPVNTVYSRIRSARLAFRAEIERLEPQPRRRSP